MHNYTRNELLVNSLSLSWNIRNGSQPSFAELLARKVNSSPKTVNSFYKNARVHQIDITLLPGSW